MALLPYTQRTVTERRGGRGRDDRGPRGPRPSREGGAPSAESPVAPEPAELLEDASVAEEVFEMEPVEAVGD